MNRYTNLTPARYNPMSLEEIMMVPMMKQKMHDQASANAYAMGLFDNKYLPQDKDKVMSGISEIQNEIKDIEDELSNKGYNPSMSKKLINLKRKRDAFLTGEGVGARGQAAYDAHMALKDHIMKSKDYFPSDRQRVIDYSLGRYTGMDDGTYNPYYGAKSIVVQDRANDYGAKVKEMKLQNVDPQQFMNDDQIKIIGGRWRLGSVANTRKYLKDNYKTIFKDPKKVADLTAAMLMADVEVRDYLTSQALMLGAKDTKSVLDYMSKTIETHSNLTSLLEGGISSYSTDQQMQNIPKEEESYKDEEEAQTKKVYVQQGKQPFYAELYESYDDLLNRANSDDIQAREHLRQVREGVQNSEEFENVARVKERSIENMIDFQPNVSEDIKNLIKDGVVKASNVKLEGGRVRLGKNSFIDKDGTIYNIKAKDFNEEDNSKLNNLSSGKGDIYLDQLKEKATKVGKFSEANLKKLDEQSKQMEELYSDLYKNISAGQQRQFTLSGVEPKDMKKFASQVHNLLGSDTAANNFKVLNVTPYYSNDGNAEKAFKKLTTPDVLKAIGAGKAEDVEIMGFQKNLFTQSPTVNLKFKYKLDDDKEAIGIAEIELKNLLSNTGDVPQSSQFFLDKISDLAGEEGVNTLMSLNEDFYTSDFKITTNKNNFGQSETYKERISSSINERFSKIAGEDYKLNVYSEGDNYEVQLKKVNGDKHQLKWSDIIPESEFNKFFKEQDDSVLYNYRWSTFLSQMIDEGYIDENIDNMTQTQFDNFLLTLKNKLYSEGEQAYVSVKDREDLVLTLME